MFLLLFVITYVTVLLTLWQLSKSPRFLRSPLAHRLFVFRMLCDVNQTAFAFDSTGPATDEEQASEVLSKSIYGKVRPSLQAAQRRMVFELDHTRLTPPVPSSAIMDPSNAVKQGRQSYYTYLERWNIDPLTDAKAHKAIVKQTAANFAKDQSLWPMEHMAYCDALGNKKGFSKPFLEMLRNDVPDRNVLPTNPLPVVYSFHTFGNDVQILKNALVQLGIRWEHFVVSYADDQSTAMPFYNEVIADAYSRSYNAAEFSSLMLRANRYNPTAFIVQESYDRWNRHDRSKQFGKCSPSSWYLGKIVLQMVWDDLDCWCIHATSGASRFVQVNPFLAATSQNYFGEHRQRNMPTVWHSVAFYVIGFGHSVWISVLVWLWSLFVPWHNIWFAFTFHCYMLVILFIVICCLTSSRS